MSLVSEALRKARAQQLRQAAEQGQLPPAVAPAPPKPRGLPLLLLASLLSGLAGAAAVVFLWSRWPGSAPVAPAPSPVAPQAAPLAAAKEAPAPLPTPVQPPQTPVRARPEAPAPAAIQPPAEPAAHTLTQLPPTPAAKLPVSQEFVLQAQLPDMVLTLDFLVYGGAKSFARINGQDVAVGGEVAGYTVEAIHEDRVVLRGRAGTVVLKLR